MTTWLFPLLASILSVVFAYLVYQQYRERRKTHQFLWTVSFILFAFAAFAEFWSEFTGTWNVTLYKLYYVSAASLVAVMGAGTVFLLANKTVARIFLGLVVVVIGLMLITALRAQVITEMFVPGIAVAGKAMPRNVRLFSPLLTVPGSLALILGALYSWARTGTFFNLLIALGALIIAGSGAAARLGRTEFLYLGEMVGLAVLFAGFLKSREVAGKNKLSA